jgi:hypothetical protein
MGSREADRMIGGENESGALLGDKGVGISTRMPYCILPLEIKAKVKISFTCSTYGYKIRSLQ